MSAEDLKQMEADNENRLQRIKECGTIYRQLVGESTVLESAIPHIVDPNVIVFNLVQKS